MCLFVTSYLARFLSTHTEFNWSVCLIALVKWSLWKRRNVGDISGALYFVGVHWNFGCIGIPRVAMSLSVLNLTLDVRATLICDFLVAGFFLLVFFLSFFTQPQIFNLCLWRDVSPLLDFWWQESGDRTGPLFMSPWLRFVSDFNLSYRFLFTFGGILPWYLFSKYLKISA